MLTTSGMQPARLAIRCVRPDLTDNREHDEDEMMLLGVRLGYAVDQTPVTLEPACEGPWTTIMLALRRTQANAVIVSNLEHVAGIDGWIRQHAQLITVEGERVLERREMSAGASS